MYSEVSVFFFTQSIKYLSLTEASRNNVVTCPRYHLAFLSVGPHSELNHWFFISVEI